MREGARERERAKERERGRERVRERATERAKAGVSVGERGIASASERAGVREGAEGERVRERDGETRLRVSGIGCAEREWASV